jgi:homocysteine S-methyltransferase
MEGFLEALDRRVLVCDGATGTEFYSRGVFLNRCFDELNLSRPDLVTGVHREYVRAGADVIETNTFGANRFKLTQFDLGEQVAAINREGARLARRAAGDRAYVAGSIGPLGVRLEPWGRTSVHEAELAFREQAAALVEGGVDLFLLETFSSLTEILTAIRAIRGVAPLPVVAQMTTGEDGHTKDGRPPESFTPEIERAGADVIGLNCSVGPAAMLETIEAMASVSSARLAAQPNAGRPRDVDGRNLYLSSPEYMASYARRFVGAGARLVGGCCGTTPEHTRQMAIAVRAAGAGARRSTVHLSGVASGSSPAPGSGASADARSPVPREARSSLARALVEGRFPVVVEIAAPRGLDLRAPADQARRYRALGATAVNVPDYPRSGARASALTLATLVEARGVETLLHYTCRDRTLIGMQSDLVGAHAMGVRNVLLTTGSPARSGNFPEASSVFEVDAIGLLNVVTRLNQGLDVAGQSLGATTSFHAGAVVNPFAPDPEAEWRRLALKVEAGADFIVTPPVLDPDGVEPALRRVARAGLPILAGVAALEGLRHAEFLASEVVGVRASDAILDRLRRASDDAAEARAVTAEIVARLRGQVQGLVVTVLHGSTVVAEELLGALGLSPVAPAEREGSVR